MIIFRLRIRSPSKVKNWRGMLLCSILLVTKEHLTDLKRVKVHLKVNTALQVLILKGSILQVWTLEFFVQLSNHLIIQRIILLPFKEIDLNWISCNANQEFLNREFQEVKGKRNLLQSQLFLSMEIKLWIVLISRLIEN